MHWSKLDLEIIIIVEKLPVTHKDKYLEIRNSIIPWMLSQDCMELFQCNSLLLYSYLRYQFINALMSN